MKRDFAVECAQVQVTRVGSDSIQGVTFGFGFGELIVFVGPSGSGKSLFLELCGGMVHPLDGVVKILGVDPMTASTSEQEALRQRIGMVFQKPGLMGNMTLFDNVALPLRYHTPLDEKSIRERVMARLLEFGISHHENLFPDDLSPSHAKFGSIARALILEQELVCIDDPLTGLDEEDVNRFTSIIHAYRMEGQVTILVAMSTPSLLLERADRVALVWEGTIIEMGTLDEVCDNITAENMKAYVTCETR